MKKRKGFAFIDVIVSISMFLFILIILGNFKIFLANTKHNVNEKMYFSQVVNNKINKIYETDDWTTLSNEIITTQNGEMVITYNNYTNKTNNSTSKIDVNFKYKDYDETYPIERSVFYENP